MINFETVKPILSWLHLHPTIANISVFLIAFAESIAVIGLIVPGSVLLIAIGTLVGSDVLAPTPTILFAIAGALAGDMLSYWVGYHYRLRIHDMWPFYHWPNMLKKGEAFFHRHGGKGVFLGRFIGPLRPITPLVAGIMKMRPLHFLIIDILSAILWALAYMLPGIILGGAATSEASPDVATHFIIMVFAAFIIGWIFYWLTKKSFLAFFSACQRILDKAWQYILRAPRLHWFRDLLASHAVTPEGNQLDVFCLLIISVFGFFLIATHVKSHGALIPTNEAIHYFFRGVRTNYIDHLMIIITLLGQETTMLAFSGLMWIYLMIQRYFREANFWVFNTLLAGGAGLVTKQFLHVPRPLGIYGANHQTWSFPSGHATLSAAILGFFVVIMAQHFSRGIRAILYFITALIVSLILFSRVYLGAHWMTDVIGGLFLGLSILFLSTLLYRRKLSTLKNPQTCFGIGIFILLMLWAFAYFHSFHKEVERYKQTWPMQSLNMQTWWDQYGDTTAPFYRPNRFGKPIQTINLQWIGEITDIQQTLTQFQWQTLDTGALKLILLTLGLNDHNKKLPLIAPFYQSHPPVLTMYFPANNEIAILRLWDSYIQVSDNPYPLYVGTINYYHPWHPRLLHRKMKIISNRIAADLLPPTLKQTSTEWEWKWADYQHYPKLNHKDDTEWTGKVLLIRPKGASNHGE